MQYSRFNNILYLSQHDLPLKGWENIWWYDLEYSWIADGEVSKNALFICFIQEKCFTSVHKLEEMIAIYIIGWATPLCPKFSFDFVQQTSLIPRSGAKKGQNNNF